MKSNFSLFVACLFGCQLQAQVVFKLSSSPSVDDAPNMVAAADVNGDGKMDLICVQYYGPSVSVLTNDGSNGFVLSGTYPVGNLPTAVTVADVNGDGKMDIITANSSSASDSVSVLTNNGSGGFSLAGTYPAGDQPTGVTAADVNGDGKVDLICADWGSWSGNTLTILTNDGSGGFVLSSSPVTGLAPYSVTAADVNGDGKVDLISANAGDGTVSVLTNNGSGGFVLACTNAVGSQPYCVTTADVNGDGKVDLVCANFGATWGNTLTVLTNVGTGRFVVASSPVVGNGAIAVAAADVNGDGKVDLISANWRDNTLSILTNNGTGGFVLATNLPVGTHPDSVTAADINGDGKVDLISPNGGNSTLSMMTNATVFPIPCGPVATGVAFVTNGSISSVVVICGGSGYTNPPTIHLVGGGGNGARAVAVVNNGVITAINVIASGSGYTNAPLVWVGPAVVPNPVLAIKPASVLSFSSLSVGNNYQLQRTFLWYWTNQFNSFTATNTFWTQTDPGRVNGGDYRLAPAPVPAQAFATAQVFFGYIIGAPIVSSGSGYVTSPAVAIVGGGGRNATATAQISAGAVTNILITSIGNGYTSPPTVEIAPPPVAALWPAVQAGMQLNSTNLVPYDNYQLEFTPDAAGVWSNWDGGLFTPAFPTNSQFVIITNGAGFFRLEDLDTP